MQLGIRMSESPLPMLRDLIQQQMPFAVSKAVNAVTYEARDALERHTTKAFTIRRPWAAQGYRVIASKKSQTPITATLYLDETRDFLSKFQAGGQKVSRTGAKLAVPVEARRGKRDLVPSRLLIRNLKLRKHTTKDGKIQLKGEQRTFVIKGKANTLIAQRTGKSGTYTVLYVFKRSVPIPASLKFFETAERAIAQFWEEKLSESLAEAIRTARRI